MSIGNNNASWCNGSTTVFGAVCLGSNPSEASIKKPQLSGFFFIPMVVFATIF